MTLRRSLLKRVRSLFNWLRLSYTRSDYKKVWNALAFDEIEAMLFVAGHTDEEQLRRTAEHTRDTLVELVGLYPNDTVLEIGAGIGRVGAAVAPSCREWIGADVSERMLTYLRKRLKHLPNVRTVLLSGFDLKPIPDNSVELVYATVVFMHLEEWERWRYVKEGFRVLRPNGRMLVDNFNLLSEEGWRFFLSIEKECDPTNRPAHISRPSTPQELEAYFWRAGFVDVQQRDQEMWAIVWGRKPLDGQNHVRS